MSKINDKVTSLLYGLLSQSMDITTEKALRAQHMAFSTKPDLKHASSVRLNGTTTLLLILFCQI